MSDYCASNYHATKYDNRFATELKSFETQQNFTFNFHKKSELVTTLYHNGLIYNIEFIPHEM